MFIIDWLNTNSGAVQAIAIAVLVGVTWWYAKQTKKMAKEMERQRKEGRVPELTLWGVPHTVNELGASVNIQNCGRGPARNIKVECWWRKDPETFFYLYDGPSSLNSGDMRLFECRPIRGQFTPSPDAADFVVRITWEDFDGIEYPPRIDKTGNEQMQAFRTQFKFTLT